MAEIDVKPEETTVHVHSRYLSAGANRYPSTADWADDGSLVAFGADANVCLWDPSSPTGITRLLSGHTSHVRAVKLLPRLPEESFTYLVTGGDDHTLRVWKVDAEMGTAACHQVLEGHTEPINCIAALKSGADQNTSRRLFVSGAADATVRVWALEAGQATLLQTIKTSTRYLPLAVALSALGDDGDALILAVAGTSSVVQIFTSSAGSATPEFTLQATLPGHENWIRSLDFVREKPERGSDLLLASASQDKYIRLWRVHQGSALSALNAAGMDVSLTALMPGNKIHKIQAGSGSGSGSGGSKQQYCVMFEALLLGHEDWIYSARWARTADGRLQLLSASADNSLSIWQSDAESGIWITAARLGEISREKGATTATGSIGGFWTGLWSPAGTTVITLGRTGSWRRWDYDAADDMWRQSFAVSGHTRAVTGISWSRDGVYLLSTSADQTTRLHAEWATTAANGSSTRTWHEMARPQIHGYDLNCIDALGPSSFVSGADEKLMRVFTEPKAVARMLSRLTGTASSADEGAFPDAANMPVLGLSNKAIDVIDDDADVPPSTNAAGLPAYNDPTDRDAVDPASMVRRSALDIHHPPFEESLSRHTLWPEVEKLYGHGYEISCLAASHDGRLVASACKASSINHAVVRLFETNAWTEIKPPLTAHALTVTRLRFSPDDRYLLSVGRDRQWAVFTRGDDENSSYKLLQANPKGHSRMILDAAFAPPLTSNNSEITIFATAGRDKQVKIWSKSTAQDEFSLALAVAQEHPVTALDFAPTPTADGELLLAVGTEGGRVLVLVLRVGEAAEVAVASTVDVGSGLWLPKAVTQLAWRPVAGGRELAVAGEDGSLRIYDFSLQ
ncbi:WD40-repeat-containing domain protein [Podospora appendiculata]|uniref:Elongator complex protein 2 n=1 Tax=Podospora appendiculata TaxID=314037 RepID=A0AAE0X4S7_9PEZI|nr:WD40-repeat-containing domain protein [Podospora appendiculata]